MFVIIKSLKTIIIIIIIFSLIRLQNIFLLNGWVLIVVGLNL